VVGVKAEDLVAKKTLTVKARRAVILCTGDMQSGKEVKAKYGPPGPFVELPGSAGGSLGNGNTGDGLTMAHAIGADHMCMEHKASTTGPAITVVTSNITPDQNFIKAGAIWVNKDGKRFADEIGDQAVLRNEQYKQPDKVAFLICDDVLAKKNLMPGSSTVAGRTFGEWKTLGAVTQGATLEELAGKLGINAAGLKATVDKYNASADAKSDAEFKRADLGPGLKVGPFYGMVGKIYSTSTADGTLNIVPETQQVLDVFGKVIPRLYAAGDMGKAGIIPLGGTHICLAFTTGRTAGKNAAAEKPWGTV
jgi:succinate dehydrogenase/fumarate reductase flavoprotein subunit